MGSQWEHCNNPRLEAVVFHSMIELHGFLFCNCCVPSLCWCVMFVGPPISLAISVQTNNLQSKSNAKLKRQLAHNQQLTANLVAEVNNRQPMLAVHLRATTETNAKLQYKRQARGKPVSASYKTFLLSIAYSPVRGVRNIQRLMKVSVRRVHESLTATAMVLHTLQLGCHV